jgi:hypothetical protein
MIYIHSTYDLCDISVLGRRAFGKRIRSWSTFNEPGNPSHHVCTVIDMIDIIIIITRFQFED